jgi:hypothetical protein
LDCREFADRLAPYLEGALAGDEFARMVDHEAGCDACRRLAGEAMVAPERALAAGAELTAEILRRTLGADCLQVARGLAAEVDGPLPAAETARVRAHLTECAECRALARALALLPEAYRALPRLRAGAAFTRGVLRATGVARPNPWGVLRAMWRSPSLLWEGALVCSLVLTPILGGPARDGAARLGGELRQARFGATAAQWRALSLDCATAAERAGRAGLELERCTLRRVAGAWSRREVVLEWIGVRAAAPAPGLDREGGSDELREP